MEPATAHTIASHSHAGQGNRFGDPVIDHLRRVAAAVPPDARSTASLHDALELRPAAGRRLPGTGLTRIELEALKLLRHAPGEPYEPYVRRTAEAPGPAGRLAQIADLDDHLAHATIPPDAPPYAWARKHLLTGRDHVAARAEDAVETTFDRVRHCIASRLCGLCWRGHPNVEPERGSGSNGAEVGVKR